MDEEEPGRPESAEAGDGGDAAERAAKRRDVLERLSRREIAAEDAAAALRDLGGS
jgi:hypothetical protein